VDGRRRSACPGRRAQEVCETVSIVNNTVCCLTSYIIYDILMDS
jgi:hypothetical protein